MHSESALAVYVNNTNCLEIFFWGAGVAVTPLDSQMALALEQACQVRSLSLNRVKQH